MLRPESLPLPLPSAPFKTSYFNRGKQYQTDGNEARAIACYYSALKLDPTFPEAKEAAQSLRDTAKADDKSAARSP